MQKHRDTLSAIERRFGSRGGPRRRGLATIPRAVTGSEDDEQQGSARTTNHVLETYREAAERPALCANSVAVGAHRRLQGSTAPHSWRDVTRTAASPWLASSASQAARAAAMVVK